MLPAVYPALPGNTFLENALGTLIFGVNLSGALAVIVAVPHAWFTKTITRRRFTHVKVMLASLIVGFLEGAVGAYIAAMLTGSWITRERVFVGYGVPVWLAYIVASCIVGFFCVSRLGSTVDKWESFDNP